MMAVRRKSSCATLLAGTATLFVWLVGAPASGADAANAAPPAAATAPATTDSQREAAAILKGMTEALARLQSFSVTLRTGYDVLQSNGQKIEFGETRRMHVQRPSRLRIEDVSSDGRQDLAVFDGHMLSVFDADQNVYAQAAQPANLDDALVYFVRDLRMRMPLAQLLSSRVAEDLPQRARTLDYVEETDLAGVRTDHIAGRGDTVDFQFWVTQGERPLPRRIVLTYKNAPGQPQFWADFVDWNTVPTFTKTTFQFSPPQGSRRIAFAVQFRGPNSARPAPEASGEIKP